MLLITFIYGFNMRVSLAAKQFNVKVYGLEFDLIGECEAEQKVVQSLLDTGVLVEVKPEKKSKK